MPAKLLCPLCETTLHTGTEGSGVVIALCEKCKLELRDEMKRPVFQQTYGSRLKAA